GLSDRRRRQVVVHSRHRRTSSVQHFGPPPALCISETSTGTGSYPFDANASASRVAAVGSTTRLPSLTALSPRTPASSAVASTASGKSRRSTARLLGENAPGKYATLSGPSTVSAVSRW